jgi:parvulin-like peptidyl-prolyl isomerase
MLVQQIDVGVKQLMAHMNDPDPASFMDAPSRNVLNQLVRMQVETKLIYQDFRRTVPAENLPNIEQALTRSFEQTELKSLMKREGVEARPDLEYKLRAKGSSLDREKRIFMERAISQQWIHQQIKLDEEITHEQMLAWYQAHLADYEKPARATWDELMVSFSKFRSDDEARDAIALLGNQVLAGAPLAEVAKARSDGPTAAHGGRRDWTTKGSLASEELDQTLFNAPIGQLSPIIRGKTGYHIIRVVERQEVTRTPFLETQKEIREKIRQDRTKKQYTEYVTRIQKQFPIWTIFDSENKKAALAEKQKEEPSRY